MGEAVERTVREDGVVEERDPLVDRAVARDDRRGPAIALDEDVVEVARLLGGELAQAEVVKLCGAPHNSTDVQYLVMWSRHWGGCDSADVVAAGCT
jgi:hypothetical protein